MKRQNTTKFTYILVIWCIVSSIALIAMSVFVFKHHVISKIEPPQAIESSNAMSIEEEIELRKECRKIALSSELTQETEPQELSKEDQEIWEKILKGELPEVN